METDQIPNENLRDKTDKSLEEERDKTDKYLDKKSKSVERDTSNEILSGRIAADKARKSKRAKVDLVNAPDSSAAGANLIQERTRADNAQEIERKKEDRARAKERYQKRLIAEAILENERKETDSNLLDERDRLDSESQLIINRLSDEQVSHDLTRAALVSRDQFLAIVSHDLRNPLSGIIIASSLMRMIISKDILDKDSLLDNIDIIEQSAANMDRMISDLLDVERMANEKIVLHLKKIDLCALLQECKDLFAPVVSSKSFSMKVTCSAKTIIAKVDHDRIFQVLSNLVGNALKFTPKGGSIVLSVQKQFNEVEISVADNGPGIAQKNMALIFDRFSQLKMRDRRGLGLGLFISKTIIEAHKGRIWARSEVGKGSVFTFAIPVTTAH
jgi:signal transduction histidine kinase